METARWRGRDRENDGNGKGERERKRESLGYHSELIRRGYTGRYIASIAAPPTIGHI